MGAKPIDANTFAEVTGLPVVVKPGGKFLLTQKFVDGMQNYAAHWDGPVVAVMHPTDVETSNLDNVEVSPDDVNFQIKPIPFDSAELRRYLPTCGFVHWGPHHLLPDLGRVLQAAGTPNSMVTEYNLQTRIQIIQAKNYSLPRRWRKYVWEWGQEKKIRDNIRRCTGFDANGTPTFNSYKSLNSRNLLYFDTRMSSSMFIDDDRLETRLQRMMTNDGPLRLLFSGRLNEMKGAMDVVLVAHELKRRGVPFQFEICGGGVSEPTMTAYLQLHDLNDCVTMRGVLDFSTELVPHICDDVDLFVCCHKQGDPSCTYLETFACGVPIAGYLNEAFAGLCQRVDAGWGVPMNEVLTLADTIERLQKNRGEIAEKSRRAVEFARQHSFEETFDRRMQFFRQCVAASPTAGA